jgi:hypothetical protein
MGALANDVDIDLEQEGTVVTLRFIDQAKQVM